jgi:type II secretory pathway component GspD/PulD (secretin)
MARLLRFGVVTLLAFLATIVVSAQEEEAPAAPPPPSGPPDMRQVQMHVWISETTERGLRDLGVNLNYKRDDESGNAINQITTNLFNPQDPRFTVTLPAPSGTTPVRPDQLGTLSDGIQTQAGAGLNFSLLRTSSGELNGVFRAIEQTDDVDLISKPELLVANGLPASIHAGGEIPYQDVKYDKGQPRLNVTFKDVGVNMKITPLIQGDGLIKLNIEDLSVIDVTRVDNIRGIDLPVFATRSQKGEVLVPDGQALVIGGLTSRVQRSSERRVPVLGNIPIAGFLFRSNRAETTNSHLLLWVAPTTVELNDMTPAAASALDFWREGSWANEDTIAREAGTLQTEP